MKQQQSKEKIMKLVSTITFWAGIALCVYSVIALITEGSANGGACPIPGSRPVMIAAVVLLLISFVTSFFTGKKSGKAPADKE